MTHRAREVGTAARCLMMFVFGVAASGLVVVGAPASAMAGQCIRDAAGFGQGGICSAGDVSIASIKVLGTCVGGTQNGATCIVSDNTDPCSVGGGTCPGTRKCVANQLITVPMRATIVSGAQTRFDIGFYIAQDGGDAKANGGACFRDYLHPVSATNGDLQLLDGNGPYYNGEIGVTPTDTCADIQQNQTNLYDLNPGGGGSVSIVCEDNDGNGILDVGTCLSWDNNNNHACNSANDTIPGTSAKCRCAFVDVGKIAVCGDGKVQTDVEQCDEGSANGSSTSCCTTTCTLKPAGTACRPSAGSCDAAETCTGSSGSCPADGFLSSSTVCRAAAGDCDLAESCPGNGPNCPADAKKTNGTACTSDGNPCTLDQCDGTNVTCQHPAGNAGTVCRASAGTCDVAETCSGTSTTCPADGFQSSSTVCRASAGECDLAENCPGNGPDCPADAKKSAGTVCTADSNPCTADRCAGTSVSCQHPAGNAGAVCRAAAGVCDVDESCTGSSTVCPADAFKPSSTVCRASAGECDPAENCPGNGPNCPADAKSAAGKSGGEGRSAGTGEQRD